VKIGCHHSPELAASSPDLGPAGRGIGRDTGLVEKLHEELTMSTPMNKTTLAAAMPGEFREWPSCSKRTWWSQHREASLNWIALGLLLAAWNASDDDTHVQAKSRPESLRGYSYVSVRAQRATAN